MDTVSSPDGTEIAFARAGSGPSIPIGDHELYQEDELAELKALIDEGKDEQALVFFLL